uniref:Uncharacterized protein n=1 Tax=Oryza brachyantha TaxID=4533 RepID=J3M5X9_ORYBR
MIIIRDSHHIKRFAFLKIITSPNPEDRGDSRIILLGKDFYAYFFWVIYTILYSRKMIYTSYRSTGCNVISIRLIRDRFTPRGAYTSRLSKFCSKTSYENLYREGFPAAQQFFHTNLAARRCYWHNNWRFLLRLNLSAFPGTSKSNATAATYRRR